MAFKPDPEDMDRYSFLHTHGSSPQGPSPHREAVRSAMSTSRPMNFLGEQAGAEVILDPMQEEVVFLPHRAPSGRGQQHRAQGVTEYANYTISHHEPEVNSKHLPKKYRCRFCIYKTSYKSDLNRHLKKHGIALQHCPLCNMPFKTAGNLENHIGQVHSDIVQNVGGVQSPLTTLCSKGALTPVEQMSPSPQMTDTLAAGNNRAPVSMADQGKDQQSVQSCRDVPELSTVLQSPLQLQCHMCPFVSNDAQALARHILTHPGEEEVSRAPPHSSPQRIPDPRLMCSICGVTRPTMDDFRAHRHSCVNSEISHRQRVWSLDNETTDPAKQNSDGDTTADGRFGFPRKETLNKLKRSLTSQNLGTSNCQALLSAPRPKPYGRKEKSSMLLPHIPTGGTDSERAGQNHTQSDRVASRALSAMETEKRVETHVAEFTIQRFMSRGNPKGMAEDSDEPCRARPLSKETPPSATSNQGQATKSNHPRHQSLSTDLIPYVESGPHERRQNDDFRLQNTLTRTRRQSAPVSSMENGNEDHPDTDQHQSRSSGGNRTLTSLHSHTESFQPLGKEKTNPQCTQTTTLIKEEPQSPDDSVDPDESDRISEFGSRSYPRSPDMIRNSGRETNENECDARGKFFRDTADLMDHVQNVHVPLAQTSVSSHTILDNRSGFNLHTLLPTDRTCRVSERSLLQQNACVMSKRQDHLQPGQRISHTKDLNGYSAQRQFFNPRVTSQPPLHGRYAVLVSNFEEFASKPYACSLCFYRTASLSELSLHVHNHITGGSTVHPSATSGFQSKEPVLVERGTSPFKVDSEDGWSFQPTTPAGGPARSCITKNSFGHVLGPRCSSRHSDRFSLHRNELSDKISSPRETGHTPDAQISTSSSSITSSGCCQRQTPGPTPSTLETGLNRSSQSSEDGPGCLTVSGVLGDCGSQASVAEHDSNYESKHSDRDCSDTLGNRREFMSVKAQPAAEDFEDITSGFVQPQGVASLHDRSTRDNQKLSMLAKNSGEKNQIPLNQNAISNKSSKHTTLHRSSKKSSHKTSRIRGPNNRRQVGANVKTRTRLSKIIYGAAKRDFRWNVASIPRYRCEQCEHRFSRKLILARHVRIVHSVCAPLNERS